MATRPTTARRPTGTRSPRRATKAQTLPEAIAEIAAKAPVLGGVRAELEEIAIATGTYLRTLRREGVPEDMAREFVGNWQASLWDTPESDEHDEDDPALD